MDETGQPGGEPAGVSGNGAHNKGVAGLDTNGWQEPDIQAGRPDGEASRPGPLHNADGAWSAGSREPAMEPIPSWRRSAVTQLTDRPDQPRRLSDLLAPVSPPVPTPFPFEGGHASSFVGTNGPVGQPTPAEPPSTPPVSGTPGPPDGYRRDGREPDGRRYDEHQFDQHKYDSRPYETPVPPWAPRAPRFAEPAPAPDRLAGAAAAGQVGEARQEPTWPEPTWPSRDRAADEPGWAVPASGEPSPIAGAPVAPPVIGRPEDAVRFSGAAPVSPAVPFHPVSGPPRPGPTPPHPGQPHAVPAPSRVDVPRPVPAQVRPEPRPVHPEPFRRPDATIRPDSTIGPDGLDPGTLSRRDGATGSEPDRDPVLDDPWADSARYAAVYRESMSAIRAASVGVAAAQAMAAAEDRAAVQAAYTAAVDAARGKADPAGLGEPARPATVDHPHLPAEAEQPHRADQSDPAAAVNQPPRAHAVPPAHAAAHAAHAPIHPAAAPTRPAAGHAQAAAEPTTPPAVPAHQAAASVHPDTVAARSAGVAVHSPKAEPISPNTPLGQPSLADYRDPLRAGDHAGQVVGPDRPAAPPAREATAPRDVSAARVGTSARGATSPRDILIPRQPGPVEEGAPLAQPVRSVPMSQPPMGHGAPHGQAAHSTPPGHSASAGQPDPSGHPGPGGQPPRPGHEGSALPVPHVLPQRVPAAPDVPEVPDDLADEDFVDHGPDLVAVNQPELARIATGLRYNEDLEEPPRPDGFDTLAVLAAVRAVPGVRDAQLRPSPTGGGVHTLRLDLADGADGAQVSRLVARLLKQRMGLAAEPRRSAEPRRAPVASPAPNTGQPHRDPGSMPVAGTAPVPRIPVPASAAEQLGGPVAANASDEHTRRRPVPAGRGRDVESTEPHRIIRSAAAPRVVIDQVQVSTLGLDATVEVRLTSGGTPAIGVASGPAVDGYVLRLAAVAATAALDQLLATVDSWEQPGRCFVEHATVVPFGSVDVAVVVVLLVSGSSAEQLTGSALVAGDPRQAVVRATLAAMNRRLDNLLS